MILSETGKMAWQYWQEIPIHFPFVELDAFIVMPDHIHGIIGFY
jgi:REP element-mobilizing transposase RayT